MTGIGMKRDPNDEVLERERLDAMFSHLHWAEHNVPGITQ